MTSLLRLLLTAGLAFSVSLSVAGSASAEESGRWQADTVTGQVTISAGVQGPEHALGVGEQLRAPFTVTTGADGQATLSRNGDRVSVGPDSSTRVLTDSRQGGGVATRVEQSQGSVLYRVRTRKKDRFEVQTPFLVSVVKGTTFNVNTDPSGSTVALMEGSVLVQSLDGAESLLLQPGQAAARSALESQLRLHDPQSMQAPVNGKVTVLRNGQGTSDGAVVLREAPSKALPTTSVRGAEAGQVRAAAPLASAIDVDAEAAGRGAAMGGDAVELGTAAVGADSVVTVDTTMDLGGAAAAAGDSVSSAVEAAAGAVGSELPDLSSAIESSTVEVEEVLRKVKKVYDDDQGEDLDELKKKIKLDD